MSSSNVRMYFGSILTLFIGKISNIGIARLMYLFLHVCRCRIFRFMSHVLAVLIARFIHLNPLLPSFLPSPPFFFEASSPNFFYSSVFFFFFSSHLILIECFWEMIVFPSANQSTPGISDRNHFFPLSLLSP